MKSGRVIGARREKLETASERASIHKKLRRQQISRIILTSSIFIAVAVLLVLLGRLLVTDGELLPAGSVSVVVPYSPTIEVIDEDAGNGAAHLSSRMKEYIGQAEADFRDLGYTPVKAVLPVGSIREVDFYLDGVSGYVKTIIDRDTGVTTEDADRMIRYLSSINISDFEYIDVRIDGKAYWK